eukprot:gnl/TRDRNA2_/TRDRNA2_69841_c0_seq1.p1 gnl/TRDRNA2_/TRDRNA2_69841_c0~~gnl/TRDRNA2_/TRDRNA2_69841_c0_seq1.p1  ORF type:complete len:221 (+),score=47.73 gnl/TRDRNA2_/TRDRNA2_69841_c0_seq1:92-754(+)
MSCQEPSENAATSPAAREEEPQSALPSPQLALQRLKAAAAVSCDPPAREVLKLFLVADRLSKEDRWSHLEVVRLQALESELWALRGEHFAESFETCRTEIVVPLSINDAVSIELHEAIVKTGAGESLEVYYALVDADADVVLYTLQPAPLFEPPDKRPLSEPAYVPPSVVDEVLANLAEDTAVTPVESGCDRKSKGGGRDRNSSAKRRKGSAADLESAAK